MSDIKSYRINTNVDGDAESINLNVNLKQNFDTLEILSLKLETENAYNFHTSDYGCLVGRVLANGNFGIPNAKISIFIQATDEDLSDAIISYLYPYKNTRTKDNEGIRYNLLPEEQLSDCHRNVGTFPSKRLVLDDDNVFEVYDKYYKYTTRSNSAGDYMIFGVPVGQQTLHVDIDLSDIGILSQKPRDMIYKGYNITQFENANMFKKDTELDNLSQIITQNNSVYIYPFWGEDEDNIIGLTRKDINIQYKFETTCIFMGSVVSDEKSNGISKKCIPSERMGKMDRLTTGEGRIETIRKKADGSVEELIVEGNQLIDGNGVWCYQIPMNLDYVKTDEYGNIVPTDDPTKGIATRAEVRFRFSLNEFENDSQYSHLSKILVPNNPTEKDGVDYNFGSKTNDENFKTLFWNNVYTVKSYIPRFQMGNFFKTKRFSGFKAVNVNNTNNPIPYNNMRVDITFMFSLQCAIFKVLLWMVGIVNKAFVAIDKINLANICDVGKKANLRCLYIGNGYCPDLQEWYFAPNCKDRPYKRTWTELTSEDKEGVIDEKSIDSGNSEEEKVCLTNKIDYFVKCVELNLAKEYDVIQFDFYNDWINGMLYMPRWFADIRKKRTYLFGLIKINPKINACTEEYFTNTRRYVQQCALSYEITDNGIVTKTANGCKSDTKQKCHKISGRKNIKIFGSNGGIVHKESNLNSQYLYYAKPCEWQNGKKVNLFATDIVLLGSIEENNNQGIPQSFNKLVSSTYQMPNALASTNMGVEGFLFGTSDGKSTCNQRLESEGVKQLDNNFESINSWSSGQEGYEKNPYDDDSAITESSGIDWGYYGPGQSANSLTNLYFPGGHFLGISCANAEVNIKSCTNLSRICEIGSMISQSHTILKKNGTSYSYINTIPNGLISGYDINDSGFKNEFATLNYNNLNTKVNSDTNFKEYDFISITPINFNGELNDKISGYSIYNNQITIEDTSADYYRFRMGVDKLTDASKRFLSTDSGYYILPQYENSFYFYFGLINGNTALDKFYNNYYAECPNMNEYEPSVNIKVEDSDSCGSGNGTITLTVENIDNPSYRIVGESSNPINIDNKKAVIKNLSAGTYTIEIYGDDMNTISRDVIVKYKIPYQPSVSVTNFTDEFEFNGTVDSDNLSKRGWFSLSDSSSAQSNYNCIVITSGNYYACIHGTVTSFEEKERVFYSGVTPSLSKWYLWLGNEKYTIYGKKYGDCNWIELLSFTPTMPSSIDLVFNNNENCTYRKLLRNKYTIGDENWIIDFLKDSSITEDIKIHFKQALFFKNSFCALDGDEMIVAITNGTMPYEIQLTGNTETLTYDSDVSKLVVGSAVTNTNISSLSNIYAPTLYMPENHDIHKDIFEYEGTKNVYNLFVQDGVGTLIPNIKLQSIYRPFFFKSVFCINDMSYTVDLGFKRNINFYCNISVCNGITDNGKYYKIYLNDIDKGEIRREKNHDDLYFPGGFSGETSLSSMSPEVFFPAYNGNVDGGDLGDLTIEGNYNIKIIDTKGFNTISKSTTIHFIGDIDGSNKYYDYNNEIKYYKISADTNNNQIYNILNSTIDKDSITPYYYDPNLGMNCVTYCRPYVTKNNGKWSDTATLKKYFPYWAINDSTKESQDERLRLTYWPAYSTDSAVTESAQCTNICWDSTIDMINKKYEKTNNYYHVMTEITEDEIKSGEDIGDDGGIIIGVYDTGESERHTNENIIIKVYKGSTSIGLFNYYRKQIFQY